MRRARFGAEGFWRAAGLVFCFFAAGALCRGGEFVFAYYNVENYLPMVREVGGKRVDGAPKPERGVAAVVSMLKRCRPDIVGVAEMGDRGMLADFQRRLKAAGMDLPHVEWVAGDGGGRHLALLSRFPIVARNSRSDVPVEVDGKKFRMGRGILDVTVEAAPGYRLRLVGLHLKSRRAVTLYDERQFRAREALVVRRHVDGILGADPKVNLLVFGDLNDTKNEFPVQEILGAPGGVRSLRALELRDPAGLVWTHYWAAADVYSRIDYLMASAGLWPEIKMRKSGIVGGREWAEASDHRPLFTTIVSRQ